MSAIPAPVTLPGSTGFMGGSLVATEAVGDFSHNVDRAYRRLVTKALVDLTDNIQHAARANENWAPYASKIIAMYADNEFFYTIVGSDEDQAAIDRLEYGADGEPPVPLLRTTLLREVPALSKMLQLELF